MMSETEAFAREVTKELEELAKLGEAVPAGAFKRAGDLDEMADYAENMSVTDCATLLLSLGKI
jgi:hypothetical protein